MAPQLDEPARVLVRLPKRVLVRLPNWLGDAVMATPALRALRRSHPRAEIALEGPPALGPLLANLPDLDAFLPDDGAVVARARRLRAGRFDWAVLLPDSPRAALGPALARIPVRAGYARDPLRRALLTRALDPPRENGRRAAIPMVERYLRVTRALGCDDAGTDVAIRVDPAAAERVEKRLALAGVGSEEGLLVVSPGARFGPSKLWPPEHFAAACDAIARRHGLLPVLAPAPGEEGVARDVAARMQERVLGLADPIIDLAELAALVARAALVLTNDTGPRQLAVAVGIPAVVLMGPTDPRLTASQLERQRVLREEVACSPCHRPVCPIDHRCMTRLSPERAVRAAEELLA